MGRGKKKPKRQKNKQVWQSASKKVTLPSGINAEEMQHLIAWAIIEADDIKEQRKKEQEEAERKEWRASTGYKEYSDKSKLWRGIKTFFNRVGCFVKLCFISEKNIHGDRASFAITKMLLQAIFSFTKLLLSLTSIICIVYGIVMFFVPTSTVVLWASNIGIIFFGVTLFILSRLFRIASIEVDKIEDRSYLFGLFASTTSIISIIIAIIAIVKGG